MKIDREAHDEIFQLQEDMCEYISNTYFPISGEIYWKVVECIAIAKQAELNGAFNK